MQVKKTQEFLGHKAAIYSLCKSTKPGFFISCGSEGIVAEWNIESGEGKAILNAPSAVFSICLIPKRELMLLGLQNGELVFVDTKANQVLKRVQLHKKSIFEIIEMPGHENVIVSAEDGAISIWNLARMDHIHYQKISLKSIRTLVIDGNRIFAGASDNFIREFDAGLSLKREWKAHSLSVFRLLLNGNTLFSTGRDAHISRWDLASPKIPTNSVPAHNYAINDLVFNTDRSLLFSGSMDKSIKIWNPNDLKLLKVINFEKNQCHWNGVNRLLWIENSLLSCSDDRKIMRWEIENLSFEK